jgi:hypothetical protein
VHAREAHGRELDERHLQLCALNRSTATKLKECLEANAKGHYGEEAWGAMTPEQQQSKTYCIGLLCRAHLRNLFTRGGARKHVSGRTSKRSQR